MALSNQGRRPEGRNDFEIGIICALGIESDAVEASFDEFWEEKGGPRYGKASGDPNSYNMGRISEHNVVLAYMPGMGKGVAASVAVNLRTSFPNIRLCLVVGVCGGAPEPTHYNRQIFVGDVIVSTAIVQYDFGRLLSDKFKRKDSHEDNLSRANPEIRAFLRQLQGLRSRKALRNSCSQYVAAITSQDGFDEWGRPPSNADKLYRSSYRHKHQDPEACDICSQCLKATDPVCDAALKLPCLRIGCEETALIPWFKRRNVPATEDPILHAQSTPPDIHFGRIASGDGVIRSSSHRDLITDEDEVLGFEMEGAGVWDNFPTIVIKGVCDYADSHKDKIWQRYAAVAAAACAKAMLCEWRSVDAAAATNSQPQDKLIETRPDGQDINVTPSNSTSNTNTNTKTDTNHLTAASSTTIMGDTFTFNNYSGAPHIQAKEQTIHGSLFFGPVTHSQTEQVLKQNLQGQEIHDSMYRGPPPPPNHQQHNRPPWSKPRSTPSTDPEEELLDPADPVHEKLIEYRNAKRRHVNEEQNKMIEYREKRQRMDEGGGEGS